MYGRIGSLVMLAGGLLSLAACAELNLALGGGAPAPDAPRAPLEQSQTLPTGAAQRVDSLDRSTAAERVAATRGGDAGQLLGQTVASLGSPADPGFWLKTPLVSVEAPGRVRDPRTRKSVAVTLIPIDGPATAGSRLSLSAMRALEVSLTDLVTVDVTG
ncbi:hypothetical protein [uncultured Roseobacter sp.]|uniref:hypothetical protein n=1 Tax=uncultured Roseobacter sp. TaxID=114847 RepID=UPI002626384B|nr:hypothetical protein [uncultured Roseobacter sp.]